MLWRNVFGEPVDLDTIDREYALNILTMVVSGRGSNRDDPLQNKLREVILSRRRKRPRDVIRAFRYNRRCRKAGLPYRAQVL